MLSTIATICSCDSGGEDDDLVDTVEELRRKCCLSSSDTFAFIRSWSPRRHPAW